MSFRTPIRSSGRSWSAHSATPGQRGAGATLILIGDPKQAIYAFRGADVYAYLAAAESAGARATLSVNRRSDQPLLDGLDALFGHARLGHPGIVYRKVSAAAGTSTTSPARRPQRGRAARAPTRRERDLQWCAPPAASPMPNRRVHSWHATLPRTWWRCSTQEQQSGSATRRATRSPPSLSRRGASPCWSHPPQRVADPDALEALGVPAVISGSGSVFGTLAAATGWRCSRRSNSPPTRRVPAPQH